MALRSKQVDKAWKMLADHEPDELITRETGLNANTLRIMRAAMRRMRENRETPDF